MRFVDDEQNATNPEPPTAPEGSRHYVAPHPLEALPPASEPAHRRHRGLLWSGLAMVAAAALLAGSGAAIGVIDQRAQPGGRAQVQAPIRLVPQDPGRTGQGSGSTASGSAQAIAARVEPAIVDINTVIQGIGQSGQAAGTGMVLTSGGEVLTNNHVVQGATSISVTVAGRSGTYDAKVVGTDPTDDVALIQLRGASGLPTVTLADSSTLTVGQHVVAIGNAFGQGGAPSVTEGSITALDQSITASDGPGSANSEQLNGMIQTDASISPGDSGGALVNDSGQVVGMITAGQTRGFRRQASSSVGFAIPAASAADVVDQIRSGSSNPNILIGQTAYLGVSVTDLDPQTASRLGLSVSAGALVVGVVAGGPADGLGIKGNSVITSVGGRAVTSAATLGPAIHAHKPGQKVQVTWVDASGTHTGTVMLVAGPAA
jgi:S1-C subfamily serine protease